MKSSLTRSLGEVASSTPSTALAIDSDVGSGLRHLPRLGAPGGRVVRLAEYGAIGRSLDASVSGRAAMGAYLRAHGGGYEVELLAHRA